MTSVLGSHPGCGGEVRRMTAAELILQRVRYGTTPERVAELDEGRWGFCEECDLAVMVVLRPRR